MPSEAPSFSPGLWPGATWARGLAAEWPKGHWRAIEVFQYFNSFIAEYWQHFRPEWRPDFEGLCMPTLCYLEDNGEPLSA